MTRDDVYGGAQALGQVALVDPDAHHEELALGLARAHAAANVLVEQRQALIDLLTLHESYEAAVDEVDRSIDALRGLHREVRHLRAVRVSGTAVFLPINLPLYSLVLFAAVPAIMSEAVHVRAPAATPEWVRDVAELSGLLRHFPNIHVHDLTRREFIERFAQPADVVVFTGRYENAEVVRAQCPGALFIYEGSGPNPIVLGPAVDLDAHFDRIVAPRLFNGGQDCAGPDAYLVHRSQVPRFVERLAGYLRGMPVGSYQSPDVRVGRILNPAPLRDLASWLADVPGEIVLGGHVDLQAAFVEPTIVVHEIADLAAIQEFFAPVFNILVYDEPAELEAWFSRPDYVEQAMYVALFGADPTASMTRHNTVLRDQTILDVEQGNTAYGGFGARANCVSIGSEQTFVGPLLISEQLAAHRFLLRQVG